MPASGGVSSESVAQRRISLLKRGGTNVELQGCGWMLGRAIAVRGNGKG
jgi:hypothetical protein